MKRLSKERVSGKLFGPGLAIALLLVAPTHPASAHQSAGGQPATPAATPPLSPQEPSGDSIGPSQPSGLFVGDDPRFPFVLQAETRGDWTVVRGMGRMAYSADDPKPVLAEFAGISVSGDRPGMRGVLTLQPDGLRLEEPGLSPFVGIYDPAGESWKLMLSPRHVVAAGRPGSAAGGDKQPAFPNPAGDPAVGPSPHELWTAASIEAQCRAILTTERPRTNTEPGVLADGDLSSLYEQALAGMDGVRMAKAGVLAEGKAEQEESKSLLLDPYVENIRILMAMRQNILEATGDSPDAANSPLPRTGRDVALDAVFGLNQMGILPDSGMGVPNQTDLSAGAPPARASSAASSGITAPVVPAVPADTANAGDPWIGRSFDQFMADQWARGRADDRISYTQLPAPDAARAWQIARVVRDRTGRVIEIVNYGSAPDGPRVTRGGTGPGGSAPAAPPDTRGGTASTGGSASGGEAGTPPGGSGGTDSPDSTTRVVRADGSNRVPDSPPNVTAPTEPGGGSRAERPPPPPIPALPLPARAPTATQLPPTRQNDGAVYDPNITILVNEDSTGSDAARFNAARAALNRAQSSGIHVQAKGPGRDGEHHADSDPAAPAGLRGFQPGDAASIGPGFLEGSIAPGGSLALSGHSERDHEGLWFNIFTTTLPNTVENAIRHNQEYWKPPTPQNDEDATVTLHRYEMSDTEGVLHYVREVHVNAEATGCAYLHFVVYQGFLIEFGHNISGRVVHDVGRDWPTVLRNAQQLIDRRFPAVPTGAANPSGRSDPGGKPHAMDGIWESATLNGISLQIGLTVQGDTIRMAMNPNGESRTAGIPTFEGTVSGDASTLSGSLPVPGPNGEASTPFTMTLSEDRQSLTITGAGATQIWRRK